jgi:hypothetical protein
MGSEKAIRRFSSREEQEAEVNRYWQSQTAGQRLAAVWDATAAAFAFKGFVYGPTRRFEATLARVQRSRG